MKEQMIPERAGQDEILEAIYNSQGLVRSVMEELGDFELKERAKEGPDSVSFTGTRPDGKRVRIIIDNGESQPAQE